MLYTCICCTYCYNKVITIVVSMLTFHWSEITTLKNIRSTLFQHWSVNIWKYDKIWHLTILKSYKKNSTCHKNYQLCITSTRSLQNSVSKKRENCWTCEYLVKNSCMKFKNRKQPFHVRSNLDCSVKHIIYVICQECHEEYIGLTECLRDRKRLHKQQIKDPKTRCIP